MSGEESLDFASVHSRREWSFKLVLVATRLCIGFGTRWEGEILENCTSNLKPRDYREAVYGIRVENSK
jgi:hypothetical protein